MNVVLATCADLPTGDEDAAALEAALADQQVRVSWQVWDDPAARWDAGLVVLRSTWDYTPRRSQFLAWTRRVPGLANPADVVEWNTDKTYLADLGAAGIATVPTSFAAPGSPVELLDDTEFVVKPSVGAGSRGAGRFGPGSVDRARAHAEALQAAGRTVLVQPYVADVDTLGERALLYADGHFSHAVTKAALLTADTAHDVEGDALYVTELIEPATATDAEREVADAAVSYVAARFGCPLYARVDLLPAASGPLVVELELTEPSLFLDHDAGAPARFAAAIAGRA